MNGRAVGDIIMVDLDACPSWNDALKCWCTLHNDKPIPSGFYLTCQDGFTQWIQSQYEHTSKICRNWGCVGHPFNQCVKYSEEAEAAIGCFFWMNGQLYCGQMCLISQSSLCIMPGLGHTFMDQRGGLLRCMARVGDGRTVVCR